MTLSVQAGSSLGGSFRRRLQLKSPTSLSQARWRISRGTEALDRLRTGVAMQVFPGIDTAHWGCHRAQHGPRGW